MRARIIAQPPSSTGRQPVPIVPRPTLILPQLSPPTIIGEPLLPVARSTSLLAPSLPTQIMSTTFAGVPSLLIAHMPSAPSTVAARAVPVTVAQATVAMTVPGSAVHALASPAPPPTPIVIVTTETKSDLPRSAPSEPLSTPQSDTGPPVVAPRSDDVSRTHRGVGDNCDWPSCKLKQVAHFHCCQCRNAYSDITRLSEHMCQVHGISAAVSVPVIQKPVNQGPTDLTNNPSTCATSPPSAGGDTAVGQSASVTSQSTSINADNTAIQLRDTPNNSAERYDNDNGNMNGSDLVIDLSSSGQDRSSCNSKSGSVSDNAEDLQSSLKITTVGGV